MTTTSPSQCDIHGLACDALAPELAALRAAGQIPWSFDTTSILLHVDTPRLWDTLEHRTATHLAQGRAVLLVYGDCHPRMQSLVVHPRVARVRGTDCFEIVLGETGYRKCRRENAFVILPRWAEHWRAMVTRGLGGEVEPIRYFMRETHSKLVYLKTLPDTEPPEEVLDAMSDHVGLPWEARPVELDTLRDRVLEASEALAHHYVLSAR